jgi:hypothetical protein
MAWYVLYDTATGAKISESDSPIIPDANRSVLTLESRPDESRSGVMWDTATRNFVPRPPKVEIDRLQDVLTHPAFADYQTWYNSLNATNKTRSRNSLIWALGNRRYRSESQSPTEVD